ncbi:MAG TPA: phosphomannomutase/phosphoglucomutase [Longimicrobiales bacterium]|nr:phosphomannomutase/phosphoglucomutase [Longimicrobiales bacterium]
MNPAPHIFRQYDIRGIVGQDLDASIAEAVGRAFGTVARRTVRDRTPRVAVGMDNRPSSPDLADGLVRGLNAAGVDVVRVGTVPTGTLYWAERTLGTDAGIQVTGSHNPAEWNGIKMSLQRASVFGEAIQDLRRLIVDGDFETGQGSDAAEDVLDRYVDDVVGRFSLPRPVKVVVDCGNGTASVVAVRLLERLGAHVVPLFCDSDGTFPNHHPDPTVDENLVDLMAAVKVHGAEVGIAFDGDGDRIGAVDEHGNVIRGDVLLLLFGLDLMERKGTGKKLVFDVKCSQVLPEVFAAHGGIPIMWKTGHSLMKKKMKDEGAPLAGELSGHICIGGDEYIGVDDAIFDACYLIDLVARSSRPLSERVADFPVYVSTPELRIDVTEENKFGLVERALAHFRDRYEVVDVDGVRVQFGDGWGLLRASNTQPVLVARYEARTAQRRDAIRAEMEAWLRDQGVEV